MQTSYPLYPALLEGGMLLVPPSLSLSSHDVCALEKTSFLPFFPADTMPPLFMSTSTALEYEARHTDCWLTISRHQCSTSGLGNWELHPYGPLLQ